MIQLNNDRRLYPRFLFALLSASGLFLSLASAFSQESCVTAQCHVTLLKAKNVHPATDSCDTCHESVSTPHPQKGKKTFKLVQEPPELCANCHDSFGQKGHVHSPVKDGMCTTCHDPHASDESKLLLEPVKDLCLTCHADQVDFKYVHGPVSAGDCTACHTPHESDSRKLLVKEGDALCLSCHLDMQDLIKKKDVHPALEGGCTSCHEPHGAPYKKLLPAEGKDLCFQCHSEILEKIEKAKLVHAAIQTEKACVSCHSPHASDHPKLLAQDGKDVCLECHKSVITKDMAVLHAPIKTGDCTPCHDPHSSQFRKLLVKEFPAEEYVPYSNHEYDLCFSCHNRDLVAYSDTSFATNFRDGDRNLHYLHVNKQEKGRSCRMCHNLHGGGNPKLIAQSVPFGKWNLPLNFVKTDTGGSCAPGCHKQQNYDRKNPGKKPEATMPK